MGESVVAYNYTNGRVSLFDSNETLLKETRHSWIPANINLEELSYKIDYKFFVGDDQKIYVVVNEKQFMDIGMYCVIEVSFDKNLLLTDATDKFKRLWFPKMAQERYNNLLKLITVDKSGFNLQKI